MHSVRHIWQKTVKVANVKLCNVSKMVYWLILQFAVSVAHTPPLLILDEPFSGLDTDGSALLRNQIEMLLAQGTAIILSTHNLQAASELCSHSITLPTSHLTLHT